MNNRIIRILALLALVVALAMPGYGSHRRHHYYRNSSGHRVHSPIHSRTRPSGATARCRDGSYSFSQHHQGTCSHHGGVAEWFR
ncbi:MAG: DUF3761 domain-containing protein [Blastocatellia bacterium]